MFKPIPYVSAEELHAIEGRAIRTSEGCLLLEVRGRSNPNAVTLDGECYTVTRVVWAENEGIAGLEDHEVIHIAECPNTGGDSIKGYKSLCIEPTHLMLGDRTLAAEMSVQRGTHCQKRGTNGR